MNRPLYKTRIDFLLWCIFSIWLIVDSVTGYFLNSGISFPLSQLIKLILLALLMLRVSENTKQLGFSIFVFIYISILMINLGIFNRDLISTITHLSKLISTIYIYLYFLISIQLYKESFLKKAGLIIKIGFFVVIINIALGFIGIGFHTYPDEQVGYKGFFFAGNELGGVIGAIFPFVLYVTYWNYSIKKYILISVFLLIISIEISTKSIILICLISSFAIPWIYGTNKQRKKIIFIGIILGIPLAIYFINNILESESDLILKLLYNYNTKGIEGLIFSGRNLFWEQRSIIFFESPIIVQLFGLGENRTVEMDPLDSLLNYGYFGLLTVILMELFLIRQAYISKHNNSYVRTLIFQNWLLFGMSLIAGHIIFSSMAGLYISLINSFAKIKYPIDKCLINLKKYS